MDRPYILGLVYAVTFGVLFVFALTPLMYGLIGFGLGNTPARSKLVLLA